MSKQKEVLVKIATDLILCSAVGFSILAFFLKGQPTKRGYFCDDDSIKYPYHDSTITDKVLYLVGFFLPIFVFSIVEFCNDVKLKKNEGSKSVALFGRRIPPIIWQLYIKIGVFVFGACLSQLTTDIGKYTIGRLRPHFIYVCDPNIPCSEEDPHKYIENFTCRGDPEKVHEARLSFPSGHSSFSMYTMVYLAIYLQARMDFNINKLLRPFLQFVALLLAYFTVLSRVMDYKHHWSDVLAGSLIGIITAILVVLFLSDLFPKAPVGGESSTSLKVSGSKTTDYDTMDLEQQT